MSEKWPDKNLLVSLRDQCVRDSNLWFPGQSQTLMHHTLALCGEVGELANIVKKIDRGSLTLESELVQHDLESESADVLIYLLNVFGLIKVDPLKAYTAKRVFNDKRFRRDASGQAATG